jgi:hypothetical protein
MEAYRVVSVRDTTLSRPVVLNLSYTHPWGYAVDRLGVHENNVGNGGKHKKKRKLK